MSKTNTGLVKHCEAQIGNPYWWGTYGNVATVDLLNRKKKQYPEQYTGTRYETAKKKHMGKRVFDCCGLVKSYMMMETPTSNPKYSASYDKNVGGLKNLCKTKGDMKSMPDIPGIIVFRKTAHVGVYIGNNTVIDAKGFNYGVVKEKLKDSDWDTWGKLDWISYAGTEPEYPTTEEGMFVTVKKFKNTSGKQLNVYADTKKSVKIGSLFKNETCDCLGIKKNPKTKKDSAIVMYPVTGTPEYKVGFTDYLKGVQ